MAFFPFYRKKKQAEPPRTKAGGEKSQLNLELEAVKRQQKAILDKAEETRKKVENIPKLIELCKRREQQIIKDRAKRSKTLRGLNKPAYRLPVSIPSGRITRKQQRSLAVKFLILCAVLGVLILLLWRAVP